MGIFPPEWITFDVGEAPLPTPEESGAGMQAPRGARWVRETSGAGKRRQPASAENRIGRSPPFLPEGLE